MESGKVGECVNTEEDIHPAREAEVHGREQLQWSKRRSRDHEGGRAGEEEETAPKTRTRVPPGRAPAPVAQAKKSCARREDGGTDS